MLNNKLLIFGIILISLSSIQAEEWGYDYLGGDLGIQRAVNFSQVNVNNSILWDGNAWSTTRWLNIDGSNANQNIDLSSYGLIAENNTFSKTHFNSNGHDDNFMTGFSNSLENGSSIQSD